MDISFADLALQFSVALIAIIIAVNSTGVVRTTISALFAIAVVALTVVMAILYFNLGSFATQSGESTSAIKKSQSSGDQINLTDTPTVVTQEMKAPQRVRQEAAAAKEQEKVAELSSDEAVLLYRKEVQPPLADARKICEEIKAFSLDDLTQLDDAAYQARKNEAIQLRYRANQTAEALLLIRPPSAIMNTHQSLIGAAEHLRQAGIRLARYFSAENEEEEKSLASGITKSTNSALRSIDNFTKVAGL